MKTTTSTRDRILAAAVAEFSARGFAGARVDRIAAAAKANKERIYAYFGDKDGLFREVMSVAAADAFSWLPEKGRDLSRASGDLFDAAFANPELLRLTAWRRLESVAGGDEKEEMAITQKVNDIRDAQEAGLIDSFWDPADVLAMVAALAGMWTNAQDVLTKIAENSAGPVRDRRGVVEEAIRRILTPVHFPEDGRGSGKASAPDLSAVENERPA
ncbi:MAG: TetR family transcriptional regulator [Rhodoglobus sp.]